MDINDLIGDENAQEKGVELEYKDTGLFFTLLYMLKGKPRDYQTRKLSDIRRRNSGEIPSDKAQEVHLDTLAYHVVIGWRGLTKKAEGQEPVAVPFSKAECRSFLSRSPVILDWVTNQSQNLANFGGNPDGDEAADKTEDAPEGESKSAPPIAATRPDQQA